MIHIEGMGWMGSILALNLAARGVEFTWNDIDAEVSAWPASTGICYPAGDDRSAADLRTWHRWANRAGRLGIPAGTVSMIDFAYSSKTAPHEGPKARAKGNGWSVSSVPAVQVDVPALVRAVRHRHADQRTPGPIISAEVTVRAHGFTNRLDKYVWGWNRPVNLRLDPALVSAQNHPRASIYCRSWHHMAYAYPLLSQPGVYLAGSSLISQSTPKKLDIEKHFTTWRERFQRMAPYAQIEGWGEPVHGWRPRARDTDSGYPVKRGNVVTFPPLWHSGVRWSPSVIAAALPLMGVKL